MNSINKTQNSNLDSSNKDFSYNFDMIVSVVDGFWEIELVDGAISPEKIIKSSVLTNTRFELPPNLTTTDWRTYIHPEDIDRLTHKISAYLNDYTDFDFYTIEYRIKRANGGYRWIQSKGKAFRNKEGMPLKLSGVLRDITDQKEILLLKDNLEQEVQKKTEELQNAFNFQTTLFDSTSFAMISTDTKGLITTFNQGAEKILGYKAEEVVGKTTPILFHLEEEIVQKGKELSKKYNKKITGINIFRYLAKEKEDNYSGKWTIRKKNGELLPTTLTISELKTEKGYFIGILGIMEDLSQLKKVEDDLKIQKERYDLIINNSADYVWLMSSDMKALYIAPSCEKFIGYTVEELMAMPISGIHPPKTIAKIKNGLKEAVRSGGKNLHVQDELEYKHKNGNTIIADVKAYAVYDRNGNLSGVAGISRDITERKKSEEKQRVQNTKIQQAYRDIKDSIHYAKTIQEALLPKKEVIESYFDKHFLLFKPKEEVSGDFYYVNKVKKHLVFAVADCTGHGVPGGFLTMLGITYLHKIIKKAKTKSMAKVLDSMRKKMKGTFKSFGDGNENGLDIALCKIDTKSNILYYAGAYQPLWIIRNKKLLEYKPTRNPVGFYPKEKPFRETKIQLKKNDMIYLFSDGFQDQFGGGRPAKYGRQRFRELLLKVHSLSMKKQKQKLAQVFQDWKGKGIQIDDMTIMGIKWKF